MIVRDQAEYITRLDIDSFPHLAPLSLLASPPHHLTTSPPHHLTTSPPRSSPRLSTYTRSFCTRSACARSPIPRPPAMINACSIWASSHTSGLTRLIRTRPKLARPPQLVPAPCHGADRLSTDRPVHAMSSVSLCRSSISGIKEVSSTAP